MVTNKNNDDPIFWQNGRYQGQQKRGNSRMVLWTLNSSAYSLFSYRQGPLNSIGAPEQSNNKITK